MSNLLKWNYGRLLDVLAVRIETATDLAGPWSTLVTLDYPETSYEHLAGTDGDYYRFVIIFRNPVDVDDAVDITFDVDIKNLGYANLVEGSEEVFDGTTTYLKDTDYSIDYLTGDITRLPGGSILAGAMVSVIFDYKTESDATIGKKPEVRPVCRVWGYMTNVSGRPLESEVVMFTVAKPPKWLNRDVLNTLPRIIRTGADGYFEVDLYQTATVHATCLRAAVNVEFPVPEVDMIDFNTILEDYQ